MKMNVILILIIIGLLAGLFSGLFGVGGGVVMVPLMVFALGYTQHQSQGMSLAVLAVPVTFLAGAYFGTKIAVSINENVLKKLFSLLLLFIAIKMFFSK